MTRAVVVSESEPATLREVDDSFLRGGGEPAPGEVTIDVSWSSLNYKDGMALGGDRGVARILPLIPGIDLVGTVAAGDAAGRFVAGQQVVLTGAGIGETRHGGFAERAIVDATSLVELPEALSPRRAAAIGTAGFTAMLSVLKLERDVEPDAGDILVTGATGGVGSIAVALLARLGYRVVACTGRAELTEYLHSLGAASVIPRESLGEPGKPLQRALYAGAVDCVGSTTLANVLAQTRWGGTVTACGLAQGSDLPTTVLPFILRAVSLVGINSVEAPLSLRRTAWQRLARDLDPALLDSVTEEASLVEAIDLGPEILSGRIRGRTVIDVRR
jgi:acrylyl-CoA reductase (NADPH)